jgi:hypothetical protein
MPGIKVKESRPEISTRKSQAADFGIYEECKAMGEGMLKRERQTAEARTILVQQERERSREHGI